MGSTYLFPTIVYNFQKRWSQVFLVARKPDDHEFQLATLHVQLDSRLLKFYIFRFFFFFFFRANFAHRRLRTATTINEPVCCCRSSYHRHACLVFSLGILTLFSFTTTFLLSMENWFHHSLVFLLFCAIVAFSMALRMTNTRVISVPDDRPSWQRNEKAWFGKMILSAC